MARPPRPRRSALASLRRRAFLQGLAASGGLGALIAPLLRSRPARAAPPRPAGTWPGAEGQAVSPLEIDLPQLQYAGNWQPRPHVMRELGLELRLRTRLEPTREPSIVSAEAPELFDTPFLYVAGQGAMPDLGAAAEAKLRRFVDLGGLIVFDDADGGRDYRFRDDVAALVSRIVPNAKLEPVPAEHVLYRSFYLIDAPAGRTRSSEFNTGVIEEGRLKVLYLPNDLGGALARDEGGQFIHGCSPGGAVQREWARRLGVNILLYATCTDYKSDRAHVETLLRRRRWRSE